MTYYLTDQTNKQTKEKKKKNTQKDKNKKTPKQREQTNKHTKEGPLKVGRQQSQPNKKMTHHVPR